MPITKDKDGKTREKPLKSINQGNKGLEILTANKNEPLKLRNIIIAESILDSLSLLQMGKFKPEETLLISTGGNFNLNENKKNLDFFLDKAANANNRILAFDNDEQGKKYTQAFSDYLNERIRMQQEPQLRNNSTYIPFSKDCNDDLLLKNITKLEKLTQKDYDDWCWNKIMELNKTKQSIPRMQMLKQLRKANDLKPMAEANKRIFNTIKPHKAIKNFSV